MHNEQCIEAYLHVQITSFFIEERKKQFHSVHNHAADISKHTQYALATSRLNEATTIASIVVVCTTIRRILMVHEPARTAMGYVATIEPPASACKTDGEFDGFDAK